MRRHRAERERRVSDLAVEVVVALKERDVAVTTHEQVAGEALRRMIEEEKVPVREIAAWCGDDLRQGEVRRLVRAATLSEEPVSTRVDT